MSRLKASVSPGEAGPVITLAGEADVSTLGALSDLLTAQLSGGAAQLVIEASGLRFVDAASVRLLAAAGQALRARGGMLVLLHPQPAVRRVLEALGLNQVVIVGDEAEHDPGTERSPGPGGALARPIPYMIISRPPRKYRIGLLSR
jgi:anti-anti-sigma factor